MTDAPRPSGVGDDPVMQYLAALQVRLAERPNFPDPDRIADDLATGAQMQPTDEDALRRQLSAYTPGTEANVERLEEGFVAGAKEYGRRHGVGYEAWVKAGVDPAVLERAGIHPDPERSGDAPGKGPAGDRDGDDGPRQ
ncbi:MAG: hypothetical protein M3144_07060 [Actinomycetota bacterium]|nr:hypothetical protein [Actinomycetota bacterium]